LPNIRIRRPGRAAPGLNPTETPMSDDADLRRLNEEYVRASLAGDVEWYGDVALVRATGSWKAKDGTPGLSRYVDVYARIGDEWKAVSAQITRPAAT
jgi:hypothetical protein